MTSRKSPVGVRNGAAAEIRFCLMFEREALSIPVTRRVLGESLRTAGVDDDSVSDILLAATEACSNVLQHGDPLAVGYVVAVNVGTTRCELVVSEHHSSPAGQGGFPQQMCLPRGRHLPRLAERQSRAPRRRLRRAQRPVWRGGPAQGRKARANHQRVTTGHLDIARLPESGRGLDVMRACVDHVSMRNRPGQGTVVTMRKRIARAGAGPAAIERAAS